MAILFKQFILLTEKVFGKVTRIKDDGDAVGYESPDDSFRCMICQFPHDMFGSKFAVITHFKLRALGDRILMKFYPSDKQAIKEVKKLKSWFNSNSIDRTQVYDYLYDNYITFDIDEILNPSDF